MSALGLNTTLPPIDPAFEPADIRNGNAQAKQAYREALGFEGILMQQLTTELANTVAGPAGDSSSNASGGSGSSSDSSGGILGSDPATSAFAGMIPTALTESLMSAGGVGIADNLARAIDPHIGAKK